MAYRELVHQLISVSIIHRCRITKASQQAGLYYGQPMILEFITAHPSCTQKELAHGLHISPASAATSLKRLEKAGLITRTADESDTRKNRLSLTQNGISALKRFRNICDETDCRMFRGFSEKEQETLKNLLERLYKNLDADEFTCEDICELINNEPTEGGNA